MTDARRILRLLGVATALLVAACSDPAVQSDPAPEIPDHLLQPALDIVDGLHNDGNPHFFFLPPISSVKSASFDGTADGTLRPTVEICPRNAAGDGCAGAPALARFTRDTGPNRDRVKVDGNDEYFVHWRMNDHRPETGAVYRIRVTLHDREIGHVDVVTLRQRDIKAYVPSPAGDVVPISDNGAFRIAFRLEEGAVESLFCDFDGDGDVEDCDIGVETAGDGQPTVVTVRTNDGSGTVAVITAPDAVFIDENGAPVGQVVVAAEVELRPPSDDLILDDDQELPYFVEVNTFPGNVFIDPAGPGVEVVLCQDTDELVARGIGDELHSQLVLYKVGDDGVTRRLESTFGAPECEGHGGSPPAPVGLLGALQQGARSLLGALAPQPLRARRLHGGLNTTVTRDVSLDREAFSTFGATLGPDAGESVAVLPALGVPGEPVEILVEVRNVLGEPFLFGGDEIVADILPAPLEAPGPGPARSPNAGTPVQVVDEGNGHYTLTYTPGAAGVDRIRIVLIRADGLGLGEIAGSPFELAIGEHYSLDGVLPANAAAGAGQVVTLVGNDFPGGATVVFRQEGQPPVEVPSLSVNWNSRWLFARLPEALASSGPGVLTEVRVVSPEGVSNPLVMPVTSTPGTPQIMKLWEASWNPEAPGGCGSAYVESDGTLVLDGATAILVQAHGLDELGGQVQLQQGGNAWTRDAGCALGQPYAAVVPLPRATDEGDAGGVPTDGAASVRVRTRVGSEWSEWSTPMDVTLSIPG
ncbi:MAG: filamin/ABP280 repeat domain-containing protein [Longimicrobiales bacterium]